VLNDSSYTFLLVAPHLEQADDSQLDELNHVYEYSLDHGYPFYCLTASSGTAISRWCDMTGAEYPFCNTDDITLKTVIRSNPGLLLLHDGVVIRKWSHNALPTEEELSKRLEENPLGQLPTETVTSKILWILTWFVLPLVLLTLADRLWAWTHWIRKKKRNHKVQSLKFKVQNTCLRFLN
jgi:triosephosphate isomerase